MSTAHVEQVRSADGTTIAFERSGNGAPVVLIGGAFNDRSTVSGLAATLAPHLTAVTYDRRCRGDSGASTDYDPGREIEDLASVISALGGAVSLFGHSSGAVLALQGAAAGLPVRKLAVSRFRTSRTGCLKTSRTSGAARLPRC